MQLLSKEQLELLAEKRLNGTLTPKEFQLLEDWYNREAGESLYWASGDQDEAALKERLFRLIQADAGIGIYADATSHTKTDTSVRAKADAEIGVRTAVNWKRWAVAASVLVIAGMGGYRLYRLRPARRAASEGISKMVPHDVAPGHEGAILTLSDGKQVVLDSTANGSLAIQGNTRVVKQNGQVVYRTENGGATASPFPSAGPLPSAIAKDAGSPPTAYNTMTTPRGRQFKLVLPDGTMVWLNAASSITYPTAFTGRERKVEITGEAYFEVKDDKAMPFYVQAGKMKVSVLGTHFNINAYSDEAFVNTTLLEGSVQVSNEGEKALLKPGQQARVIARQVSSTQKGQITIVNGADMEKVMAWKNNVFDFQDASLDEVMRQLERWYDIDVVYEKGIPRLEFIGKMGRDLTLSKVLHGLEMSKVHFRIEGGRRLVVLP